MMKFLGKILRVDGAGTSPEDEARIREVERELDHARGDLRQKVQKFDSGTRLMMQWAAANAMVTARGQHGEN